MLKRIKHNDHGIAAFEMEENCRDELKRISKDALIEFYRVYQFLNKKNMEEMKR